ncbi:MAG TPA: tyrosine-type recombinase/integrase [Gaiellaceae bacterium]|jgi:integrase|nr:tyrosine-type recombinase/integrase [Gaiellaceae bacterium]
MKRKRVERGLYRQQNGTYGVYLLVDGKPRYKTVGIKLAEARRQRDLLASKAHTGQLPPSSRLTFAQLAENWLQGFEALVAAGERGERTLENYRYHLDKHLLPAFGRKRLPEITTDDIAQLIARLRAQGLAAKTINGALVPLGRILQHALRRGHITDNPLRRLEQHERPRIYRREQRVLDHVQISRLLDAALPRYHAFLATALYTGLRLSELLGLIWADIDLESGLIHVRYQLSRARADQPARRVRLKTGAATRDIPLLPQLAALLKRHKLASPHSRDNDYVFASARGTALAPRNVERRGLGRAANNAGLNPADQPRLRVHDLRHTFASHLIIELKLDVAQVSRILGHARPSITLDTYTHLFNHAAHTADIRDRMATSAFGLLLEPGR